jgi:peptidoglycan/LPS O-acetylase OafA/YrhL
MTPITGRPEAACHPGGVVATDLERVRQPPPGSSGPLSLRHQPALDGLRGVAVVAVLLFHGGVAWATGGYLGVDVFFVLSGFLITSLLVTERQRSGRISIAGFYGRRLRRLVPAMAAMLVGVAIYARWLAPAWQLPDIWGDLRATVGYYANWRFVLEDRGYFDAFAAPSPLTHTWSLAVEEQWYLLWPVLVAVLLRRSPEGDRRLTAPILVTAVLCLGSALWCAMLATPTGDPSRVHYGTDTRAQQLLAGAVLAMLCHRAGRWTVGDALRRPLDVAGLAGLGWVLWLSSTIDEGTAWLYEGGLLAVSVAVAVVILAAVQPSGLVRSVLSLRPLRAAGLVSYGLYLYHYPIYVVLSAERTGLHGDALLALRLALTAGVATASYYLLERPVRRGRIPWPPLVAGVGVALAGAAVAVAVAVPSGPVGTPGLPAAGAATASGAPADPASVFGFEVVPAPVVPPGDDRLKVIMTGDSVALTLALGYLGVSATAPMIMWSRPVLGCQLFTGERVVGGRPTPEDPQCPLYREDRHHWVPEFRPDVVAVLSGTWDSYDIVVDGQRLDVGTPAHDQWFGRQLDLLVAQFSVTGARVVFLTAPCNERAEGLGGGGLPENDEKRIDHLNDLYRQAAERSPDQAGVVDLHGLVCPGGRYAEEVDGVPMRSDGVHFTDAAAGYIRDWLYPRLLTLAPPRPGLEVSPP